MLKWEELPDKLRTDEVRPYYDLLYKREISLIFKRIFDICVSFVMLVLLSPLFLMLTIAIKLDSKGPVFYRQIRVTTYGRQFRIHKFRTMCDGADKKGTLVTVGNDSRITRVGSFIRDRRLDELPQLIDVLCGNMTFVGTRPEVQKYVDCYTPEMYATLLLPAGITSNASIYFRSEAELLENASDVDGCYINEILPKKMKWNLEDIKHFGFFGEIKIMFDTVFAVLGLLNTDTDGNN